MESDDGGVKIQINANNYQSLRVMIDNVEEYKFKLLILVILWWKSEITQENTTKKSQIMFCE